MVKTHSSSTTDNGLHVPDDLDLESVRELSALGTSSHRIPFDMLRRQ